MTNTWVLVLLPFIAAAIGWFTNFIAIKMLFHPREPKKLLFITLHGVFPKRQQQVAERIAQLVATELISIEDIQQNIVTKDGMDIALLQIGRKLDNYFAFTLPQKFPIASKLITKKMKQRIKNEVLHEISEAAPQLIEHHVAGIGNQLDIESIIIEKVSALSPKKLEGLVWSILDKEFQFIEIIGAVIGFVIGLIQVGITLLAF